MNMKLRDILKEVENKEVYCEYEGSCKKPPFGWDANDMATEVNASVILQNDYLKTTNIPFLIGRINMIDPKGAKGVKFDGSFITGCTRSNVIWVYYPEGKHDVHFFFKPKKNFVDPSSHKASNQNVDRGT